MGLIIQRGTKSLGLTVPTEDKVFCLLLTGVAVAGKIALSETKQIFGSAALATLGITSGNNPLAYKDISDFYKFAGEGAELNFMLVSDATSLATMCDKANNIAKKLVDSTNGRSVVLMVNKKAAAGYTVTLATGFDADVWAAITKLNELAADYDAQNIPFVGVLPGFGFSSANIADMPARTTLTNDFVALNCYCENNDNLVSMGIFAGWLAGLQVHENAGLTSRGKVTDTAFYPDGSTWLSLKASVEVLASKGLIIPNKVGSRSGFYYKDDPCMTAKTSDYSSVSWNRVINKAKRIVFDVLIDKLNSDVDTDPLTGKIESTVASDWESDCENAIRDQMIKVTKKRPKKEISGVKITVDPDSDILNDEVDVTISIVRKGQAKDIVATIKYVETLEEA
jgi:hypothetical protein